MRDGTGGVWVCVFFSWQKNETRNICHGNIGTLWIQTEIDRNTVDNGKSEGKNINNDHRAEDMKRNQVTFFFPQPTQKSSGWIVEKEEEEDFKKKKWRLRPVFSEEEKKKKKKKKTAHGTVNCSERRSCSLKRLTVPCWNSADDASRNVYLPGWTNYDYSFSFVLSYFMIEKSIRTDLTEILSISNLYLNKIRRVSTDVA